MKQINILTNRFNTAKELNTYCHMFNLVIDLESSMLKVNMICLTNHDNYNVSRPYTVTPLIDTCVCSHSLGGD